MEEFPDLDELQWLESTTNFDDDIEYEVDEPPDYHHPAEPQPPETHEEEKLIQENNTTVHFNLDPPPAAVSNAINNNYKKRHRSASPGLESEEDGNNKAARVEEEEVVSVDVPRWREVEEEVWEDVSRFRDEEVVVSEEKKSLSRYASEIEGDCVSVTAPYDGSGGGSGERVYAKIERKVFGDCDVNVSMFKRPADSNGLISESVSVLLQKAEQEALMKALRDSSEVQISSSPPESAVVTEELWVNKYAPRSFTELLSDEQTNREVLCWLKRWDSVVFGADIRNTGDEVLSALKRHSSLPHSQKKSDTDFLWKNRGPMFAKRYMGHSAMTEHEDMRLKDTDGQKSKKQNGSGPPDQKVLLLCGPPGLGKTTLAHVAAKHCGYDVLEINASDDRSSAILEKKIMDAVQMNSIMGDSKPKCLIIDEIDGALGDGKGAVEILLRMIAADTKSHAGKESSTSEEHHGRKSVKKGRKGVSLSRPVICICNDLYAPSLRPLRNIAKVHVFAQPTVNRVVTRLKYICNKEGLKTSSIALTALAEYTECDIRSCLNTLQFLHKKKESLNLAALSFQVIGRKDMTRSVFDVWKEVFQKKKVKQRANCDVAPLKTFDAHDSLYSLVSYRGDYELILDGIHENFLRLHYHDPLLQKTVHCLNALGVSDLLQQYVMRSHNMSLLAYYPPITIKIHQLLAGVERPSIEWPKSFHRYRMSLIGKMEILRSWQSGIVPCISRHFSADSFVKDTISQLLHILSPVGLRPVALHLLSDKEKNDFAQVISTMVSYSLTYKNHKSDPLANNSILDGTMDISQMSLDPPIQGFVLFKDYKPGHHELKPAVKQVLVHEVEKQKIVRESTGRLTESIVSSKEQRDPGSKKENAACVDFSKGRVNITSQKDSCKPLIYGHPSSHGSVGTSADGASVDVMKPKSTGDVKKASNGSFNFFDRFRKLSDKGVQDAGSLPEKTATAERDKRVLIFKFNEGFTNAVKRPVRIREFLS